MLRLALAFLLQMQAPGGAWAQQQPELICAPRARLVAKLAKEFGETTVAVGRTHAGHLLEITASEDGTWTALTISPSKIACLQVSGDGWSFIRKTDEKE